MVLRFIIDSLEGIGQVTAQLKSFKVVNRANKKRNKVGESPPPVITWRNRNLSAQIAPLEKLSRSAFGRLVSQNF